MVIALLLSLLVSLFFQANQVSARTLVEPSEEIGGNLPEKIKKFVDSRIEWAIELGDKIEAEYGSKPPTVSVLAEASYESGFGQSNFCLVHNNDFGIGGKANPMDFVSHYESWEYYYRLVSTREGYVVNGSLTATNTYGYISALVAGGYCSDYGYVRDVVSVAERIKPYVEAKEAEIRAEKKAAKEARAHEVHEKLLASLAALTEERRVPK